MKWREPFDNVIYHNKAIHWQKCNNPDQCLKELEIVET